MAITPTLGAAAILSVAGTTLAFSPAAQLNTQTIVVGIVIPGTTTVSGISDGTNTFTLQSSVTNGSAIRSEQWTCVVASSATRTITISFSGSTKAVACYEEYAGPTGIGNIATPTTGTSGQAEIDVIIQDQGSYVVSCQGFASLVTDSLSGQTGTSRQFVTPALGTTSMDLIDSTGPFASTLVTASGIAPARAWAATGIELRTGVSPAVATVSSVFVPQAIYSPAYVASVIQSPVWVGPRYTSLALPAAQIGLAYSTTLTTTAVSVGPETWWIVSGALPPGLSLNSATGVISGTPTTLGSYSFSVWVVDRNGWGQVYDFTIDVVTTLSGGGGSFTYAS